MPRQGVIKKQRPGGLGGELADPGAEPFGGDSGGEQHDHRESDDEGEASTARGFGGCRGREERANGESHDEAAEVGGVADAGDGRAERDGLLRSGIEGGNSTEQHDGEHEYARGDENDGHRE